MTTTDTIKALRDALTEMIAQVELYAPQSLQRVGQSDVWVRNDYSQKAIDSAKAALTADASDQAPTRLDLMSLIRSQMHRSYTAGHEGDEIDPKHITEIEDAVRALAARPAPVGAEQVPEGWQLVPIDPTETMVIDGFESRPDWGFTPYEEMEKYEAMSGCRQAAHRARLCYAAMLAAAPSAPAITGNVLVSRATLEMIYDAMNHMGDQLNEMDVVEADDEKVFPAFDLIRDLMAKPAAPAAPIAEVTADPRLQDLRMLVERLARKLEKECPGTDLVPQALDYLRRKGLQGSPLRAEPSPSKSAEHANPEPVNVSAMSVQPLCNSVPVAHAKLAEGASERDSFEVYWRKVDLSPSLQYQNRFEINCEGNYLYVETRLAWETWQARGQQAGAVDGEASCR